MGKLERTTRKKDRFKSLANGTIGIRETIDHKSLKVLISLLHVLSMV